MKATKVYIMVCALCTATIAGNLLSAVVTAAQDPAVRIKVTVQNQTTNSPVSDANNKDGALATKTGDILKYTATITNEAEESQDNKNDFISTKVISALPAGVELVSNASTREINEDLGSIKPGKSATKEYTVRVTSRGGDVIENKACFTGRYEAQNKPQSDCESAFITVAGTTPPVNNTPTPTAPETSAPTTEEKPQETPAAPEAATDGKNSGALPTTGPSDVIAPLAALSAGGLAYAGRLITLKRRG